MRWSTWIKVFGRKADKLAINSIVYFRRGNLPQCGRIVAEGDTIRVPLMRCDEQGTILYHRVYWRNRSQLYAKAAIAALLLAAGPACAFCPDPQPTEIIINGRMQ